MSNAYFYSVASSRYGFDISRQDGILMRVSGQSRQEDIRSPSAVRFHRHQAKRRSDVFMSHDKMSKNDDMSG